MRGSQIKKIALFCLCIAFSTGSSQQLKGCIMFQMCDAGCAMVTGGTFAVGGSVALVVSALLYCNKNPIAGTVFGVPGLLSTVCGLNYFVRGWSKFWGRKKRKKEKMVQYVYVDRPQDGERMIDHQKRTGGPQSSRD